MDLCFAWGVAVSNFFSDRGVLWPTINVLDMAYNIGLPIHDTDKLDALSKGFYDHSGGILDGCGLAMDVLVFLTWQLYDYEVIYKKDYRYCKGGFAIVVLAGCNVDCCFIVASCNNQLPMIFFSIGDEALMKRSPIQTSF